MMLFSPRVASVIVIVTALSALAAIAIVIALALASAALALALAMLAKLASLLPAIAAAAILRQSKFA